MRETAALHAKRLVRMHGLAVWLVYAHFSTLDWIASTSIMTCPVMGTYG